MTAAVVTESADLRSAAAGSAQRAVVMTMGALHDGHAELVREARRRVGPDGSVVVTIFVNPTQFGVGEDYSRYPRTIDDDLGLCSAAGADIVFVPDVVEVYGNASGFRPDSVTVDPGPLGDILEGASRPGHFRGVLTVVMKLMGLTAPDIALFGEKDFQQLTLIERMVRDLSLPVTVVGVPTVREPDGLARSSRNRYLSAEERRMAVVVPAALQAVVDHGAAGIDAALAAGRAVLQSEPAVRLDYLAITDPALGAAPEQGSARVLIAARVGATRLIDNMSCRVGV